MGLHPPAPLRFSLLLQGIEPCYHPARTSGLGIKIPVKRVIDYAVSSSDIFWLQSGANLLLPDQVKPSVNRIRAAVEKQAVKDSMNPFEELSIEEAVRMRERKVPVEDVVAVSAGPVKAQIVLRTIRVMAMGANRSIHVEVPVMDGKLDPFVVGAL